MTGLLQNEWIKVRKQTGYRVCLIVFAVLLILMPLGSKLLSVLFSAFDEDFSQYYLERAEECREYGDTLYAEYYTGMSEAFAFFEKQGIGSDSFRYRDYIEEYTDLCVSERLYQKALDGTLTPEQIVDVDGYHLIPDAAVDEDGKVKDSFDLEAAWKKKQTERQALEEEILNADAQSIVRKQIGICTANVTEAKATVRELEQMAQTYPDDEKIAYRLEAAKLSLEAEEELLAGYQWLLTHGFGSDDWQYEAVNEVLSEATGYYSTLAVMPEEVFREDPSNAKSSYSAYVRRIGDLDTAVRGTSSTVWYALEKNVPLGVSEYSTSRSLLLGYMDSASNWISWLLMVMAVLIVSNEFMSGTIRLLVIRPKKRSKIILSKLFCVLLIGAGLTLVSFVLLLLLTLATNGAGDLFVPVLFGYGDRVFAVNGVLYLLLYALLGFIETAFYTSVTFLFAVLIRKTALPIVLTFVFDMVVGGIQTGLRWCQYFFSFHFFDYTILTNFSLTERLVSPAESLYADGLYTYLFNNSACLPVGVLMVLLHTALAVWLAVIAFSKREIRN